MTPARFAAITGRYAGLTVGVVGDFCLDRYLEIDPARGESSIETGLDVYNVVNVRSQPGAAGTVLNNLVALGVGTMIPVGFCGDDGEGYELERALRAMPGVDASLFLRTPLRRTFVYCKPLILKPGHPPRELNRLDSKNWTPTPDELQLQLASSVKDLARRVDAMIVMDQVDLPETGTVTKRVREAAAAAGVRVALADSRRGLGDYPPLGHKMNAAELAKMMRVELPREIEGIGNLAAELAGRTGQPVFVTLAERGMVGALADGTIHSVASHPLRGPIDVVGAGDAVTASLAAALAAEATPAEAMELAMAAASVVLHQLGTTGTATLPQIASLVVTTSAGSARRL